MLTGDNSILNNTSRAAVQTEIAGIEEEANSIYLSKMMSGKDYMADVSMEDIVSQLQTEGYEIETAISDSSSITGITLDSSSLSIKKDETATINVSYIGSSDSNNYYAVVKGKYYLMTKDKNGVKIAREPSDVNSSGSGSTLAATSSNTSYVKVDNINGNKITLKGVSAGSSTITVTYGSFSATCAAAVVVTPTDTQIAGANSSNTVTSTFGRIDVIWLDTSNKVISTPNAPKLGDMTKVTWTETSDGWTEDTTANSTWYNYKVGTGNDDNLSSMWANAKDSNGSYFVWIPRYAYRITYYSDSAYTNVTGYYDGIGMWNATNGNVKYKLDDGIKTVEYKGNKYIVHPAFETNLDNGGWDSELTGFWIAKYEMSRAGATDSSAGSGTTFKSVPGVQSARSINIGNMYTYSLKYASAKNSHMTKNSEWGAAAYLAFSQYGRNGHEVDINNSNDYITGNGGGSTSASFASGTTNAYNTKIGAKASTTGNIYGIYDMSGGAWEYTAAFNDTDTDTDNYESKYGSSFASTTNSSTKYATKYSNGTDTESGTKIYEVGKIGDGTKETYSGSSSYSWNPNNDYAYFAYSSSPFFIRGGLYLDGSDAGVFSSLAYDGSSSSIDSFRVVLCP